MFVNRGVDMKKGAKHKGAMRGSATGRSISCNGDKKGRERNEKEGK